MNPFLTIELNRDEKKHLYIQLFKALELMIVNGRLQPHEKLPSVRKLANWLGVNSVTVVGAYKQLENEGLVYKKVGSGTFVMPVEEDQEQNLQGENWDGGNLSIRFGRSTPTSDLFPVEPFKRVLNQILDRDKGKAFNYHDSFGYGPLRASVVSYLEKMHVTVEADRVQVISGAQQGIDIVSKTLLNHGDVVLVEGPSYTGALAAFKMRGAKIVEVPLKKDGIHIEAFENAVKTHKPKLFYTMPNLQNPTGYTYSKEKKNAVLSLAKEKKMWILEDDCAGDLFFSGDDIVPLKALDQGERVIYVKSFSKIYMPGLRLGFMVAPQKWGRELMLTKHITDISTSGLIQRAFDLYLREGLWEEQIALMKNIFKGRYIRTVSALNKYLPSACSYEKPMGGLNFWICLPQWADSDVFFEYSKRMGIEIVPQSAFHVSQGHYSGFRLSVAGVHEERIEGWVEALCREIDIFLKKIPFS